MIETACIMPNDYENATNLKINKLKSECLIIGKTSVSVNSIVTENSFKFSHQICHLGIQIDDEFKLLSENWVLKIKKMKRLRTQLL